MLEAYVQIFARGLRVCLSAPILWLAVLLLSVPSPPDRTVAWLPDCVLTLLVLTAAFLGMVAVPYAVSQAEKGRQPGLAEVCQVARKVAARYAGLIAIVALPVLGAFAIGYAIFSKALAANVVIIIVVLGKYVLLPIAGEAITFALAGIVLRGLSTFRALSESFTLLAHNFGLALLIGISLSLLMLIPQGVLLAVEGGVDAAVLALTSFRAIAANPEAGSDIVRWYLIQWFVYLPFAVYQWSVLVVMYISVVERSGPLESSAKLAA